MSGTSLLTGTKTTFKDDAVALQLKLPLGLALSQDLNAAGAPFVLGGVRPCGVRTEDRADPPHKDETLADSQTVHVLVTLARKAVPVSGTHP